MARFYFHVRADDELRRDEEGIDLPDVSAARHEALLLASGPMTDYRAYVISTEGHFVNVITLDCADDKVAIKEARAIA
jgi:hypothetical protein